MDSDERKGYSGYRTNPPTSTNSGKYDNSKSKRDPLKSKHESVTAAVEDTKEKVSQEGFERNILNFFVDSMIPLRIVENSYFVKHLDFCKKDNGINKLFLSEEISKVSFYQIFEIKKMLNLAKCVAVVVEVWPADQSFLVFTVHWIDTHLQRRSAAIACRQIKGAPPTTEDHILAMLPEIYVELELDPSTVLFRIVPNVMTLYIEPLKQIGFNTTGFFASPATDGHNASITDNGNCEYSTKNDGKNVLGAKQGEDVQGNRSSGRDNEGTVVFDFNVFPLLSILRPAFVQVLLDYNKPLGQMHSIITNKCTELLNAAAEPKSHNIVRDILGHTLPRPPAGWKNHYETLKTVIEIKSNYTQLAKALIIQNVLNDDEFQYIIEYLQCTDIILRAVDVLDEDSFAGIALPCLYQIIYKLQKVGPTLHHCKSLAEAYQMFIENRFEGYLNMLDNTNRWAAIAALSHPRFRHKWLVRVTPGEQRRYVDLFKNIVRKEMSECSDPVVDIQENNNNERPKDDDFFDFEGNTENVIEDDYFSEIKADLMVYKFFDEQSCDMNILERYPVIKRVFVKYNTPLLESFSYIKRMVSFADSFNPQILSEDLFDERVIIKWNLLFGLGI